MKRTLLILLLGANYCLAQHPVKWNFSSSKMNDATLLQFDADIEKGWHVYSQFTPDGGPLPMLITFDSSACFSLMGKAAEPAPVEEFDSVFAMKVKYLTGKPMLKQKITINKTPCRITGRIDYQACKDICIPLDTMFVFTIDK